MAGRSFWDVIVDMSRRVDAIQESRYPAQQVQPPVGTGAGPDTLEGVYAKIREAGYHTPPLLLDMTYNGMRRLVGALSFQDRYRPGFAGQQKIFFGRCMYHNKTHQFWPDKIEHIEVTDLEFVDNNYPVELG